MHVAPGLCLSLPTCRRFTSLDHGHSKTSELFCVKPDSLGGKRANGCDFFFFLEVRYNQHTIKFTPLRCEIQWILVYSENSTTITLSNVPEQASSPLAVTPHFPPTLPMSASDNLCSLAMICIFRASDRVEFHSM